MNCILFPSIKLQQTEAQNADLSVLFNVAHESRVFTILRQEQVSLDLLRLQR